MDLAPFFWGDSLAAGGIWDATELVEVATPTASDAPASLGTPRCHAHWGL